MKCRSRMKESQHPKVNYHTSLDHPCKNFIRQTIFQEETSNKVHHLDTFNLLNIQNH